MNAWKKTIVTTKQCAQTLCEDTTAVVQHKDLQEMEKSAPVINLKLNAGKTDTQEQQQRLLFSFQCWYRIFLVILLFLNFWSTCIVHHLYSEPQRF